MDDAELAEIRAKRMAQLRAEQGGARGANASEAEDRMRQQNEMKNSMLSQILSQDARARLNTLQIAKPEKARQVETMLISMAQRGRIQGQLGEEQLKNILENVSSSKSQSSVSFDRRRATLDSDDELDL
ncbi:programmed cell death protein 5 [Cloeon dipterum]|uniref:programmed cell death protein 5 n=1 Tax=Cloeon dipterum TaxID=197152 RepID=UPI00321FAFC9